MGLFGATTFLPVAQAAAWKYVANQVLGSAAVSVTFSGLAGSHWYSLSAHILKDASTGNPTTLLRLNNDSATNYAAGRIQTNGATRTATQVATQTSISSVSTMGANAAQSYQSVISKPAAAVRALAWIILGFEQAGAVQVAERISGEWGNTAATINRIDFLLSTNLMAAATSFRLDSKDAS